MKTRPIVMVCVAVAILIGGFYLGLQFLSNIQQTSLDTRAVPGEKTWRECSKSSDFVKIHNVTLQPYPVKRGQELRVVVDYHLSQEIADGEVKIDFKLFLLPFDLTLELCETLQKIGEYCPIKEGSGAFNVTATIPDILPRMVSGKVKLSTTINDKNTEVMCVELHLKLE